MTNLTIHITGSPVHVNAITDDLRAVYRIVSKQDKAEKGDFIDRRLVIATEAPGEFGPEPAEGFREKEQST